MDPVLLARLQFGVTTVYHFFFVPLTLGLSILVAIMETFYVRTGKQLYKDMTKFFGKLFLVNFAMGVVTGIVQEFQFGMNWSEYSRFVGDIFGAPLAIEALLAFFLESTFLGLWIFGWERLSKGLHATVMWMVALGSNLSAVWILIANSFMQQPVGYALNAETGRAEMIDFAALVFNPTAVLAVLHTISAGLTVASFFILGISAYHLVRKNKPEMFQRAFLIGAVSGLIAVAAVGLVGHEMGIHITKIQPMKTAAMEALRETANPASFSLLTISTPQEDKDPIDIRIPKVLSLLLYNRLEGEVLGYENLQAEYEATYGPGNYIPPVNTLYWSFRLMVGAGFLMVALALLALYIHWKKNSKLSKWMLHIFPWAVFLPYIATTTGWLMTEMGRWPWVVYGVLRTEDGVSSSVPAYQVLISLIGYTLVYAALMVADIYLLAKFARKAETGQDAEPGDAVPSLVG